MQVQSCLTPEIGTFAIPGSMSGIEDDIRMVRELVQWTGTNVNQVSKKIGKPNTTLNRYFNGTAKNRLARETVNKLRETFVEFPGFQGVEMVPFRSEDYLEIEVLASFAGMGGGGSGEGDHVYTLVPRRLVEDELRAKPADLLMIEARGESMMPDFLHGDQILIDKRDRNPVQPGAFALWDGDGFVVKLVERVPSKRGFYRVFSTNGRFSSYEVGEDQINIMGRPVWFGRRL